jgi:nitrate reductase molybdenum cofactor assembly chaperone NarJ/NarW
MQLDRDILLRLSRALEYPRDAGAAREEDYTAAFDLAPIASPYLGDHLFGATAARHLFLAKVKQLFRTAGVDPGPELPDHLAAVLRLAALAPSSPDLDDLVTEGALPAARKMLALLVESRSPYAEPLEAVVATLERAVAPTHTVEAAP